MAAYPVTNAELLGFYSYGWAAEGFSALATGVFFPIVLEELAAQAGVDHHNHTLPCSRTENGYICDVQLGTAFIDTSSAVFCYCRLTSLDYRFSIDPASTIC